MQTSNELTKKSKKRSFSEAWLNDIRYKSWLHKVSSEVVFIIVVHAIKNFHVIQYMSQNMPNLRITIIKKNHYYVIMIIIY